MSGLSPRYQPRVACDYFLRRRSPSREYYSLLRGGGVGRGGGGQPRQRAAGLGARAKLVATFTFLLYLRRVHPYHHVLGGSMRRSALLEGVEIPGVTRCVRSAQKYMT